MLVHYLKIAWRNIWNDKFYSAINLIGLTVAFTVIFLFVQWIRYELSFEDWNPNADRIYQVQEVEKRTDGIHKKMWLRRGMYKELKEKYPIIEEAVLFNNYAKSMIVNNNQPVMYDQAEASLNFLKVFPMKCIAGTTANIEKNKYAVFISEDAANRFFGNPEKALGKEIIHFMNSYSIEGVLQVPANSIIQFDALILQDGWMLDSGVNYILLKKNTLFTEKQQRIMANFLTENYESENKLLFQPLKRLHLYTDNNTQKVSYQKIYFGSIKEIRVLAVIVLLVLLLAVINYVNTSTARSMSRVREVGVRKIGGSTRRQLISRFLIEALIISSIAVFLAADIAKVLHHPFENVMGNSFPFHFDDFTILFSIVICLLTSAMAGGYAAFYLSSLNPVTVLAGNTSKTGSKNILRKVLLTFQFAVAIGVLVCTWMVFRQLNYMLNKDLGFEREGIYMFDTSLMYDSENFISELKKNPYIINATMASGAPYNVTWGYGGVSWDEAPSGAREISFAEISCDHRFDETFGLQVIQGEFIPQGLQWWGKANANSFNIVINENFKELIGVDNPIGMSIEYGKNIKFKGKIIGVIKNFYFRPMNYKLSPLILSFNPENTIKMFIKIDSKHEKEALQHIRSTYDKMKNDAGLLSSRPFILTPMEKEYREMYKTETRLQKILGIFSLLSIVLSFMGIVSMIAFIIEKRTKEIGIRKINGAKWLDIVQEFWKEFLFLAGIAAVPAVLGSYWFMHGWLQQYIYRPAFGWWIFILVPVFIGLLTALILLFQVQSIAKRNPVECLKSE